jgi:hypothetical protein
MIYSAAHIHELRHRQLRDWMRAKALEEAFASMPGEQGRSFFSGASVRVGDYAVHVVLSVDRKAVEDVPQIATEERDRLRVHKSLVHAVIDEVLRLAARALYLPDPGADLMVLGASRDEIVRRATEATVRSAMYCAGSVDASERHLLLSNLSALPYEGRTGAGRLVIAQSSNPAIEMSVRLSQPARVRDFSAVRKLLEASGSEVDLLSDGDLVYGLGTVSASYDTTSESVFVVHLTGRGSWELTHAGEALLTVRDGVPHLPTRVLDENYFEDLADRLFSNADLDALLEAARATGNHAHGAMLIISGDAAGEAARLSPQSWSIEPTRLTPALLTQLTNMDGAVLVDPQGQCHAIGVILDGIAHGKGDPARGSRFNNAIRYLDSNPPPTIIIVYSADGGIDILPRLHPRIERRLVEDAVEGYLKVASATSLDVREVNSAWDVVKAVQFYLSSEQCEELNRARARVDEWRKESSNIWIVESDLKPNPDMNESYWL